MGLEDINNVWDTRLAWSCLFMQISHVFLVYYLAPCYKELVWQVLQSNKECCVSGTQGWLRQNSNIRLKKGRLKGVSVLYPTWACVLPTFHVTLLFAIVLFLMRLSLSILVIWRGRCVGACDTKKHALGICAAFVCSRNDLYKSIGVTLQSTTSNVVSLYLQSLDSFPKCL